MNRRDFTNFFQRFVYIFSSALQNAVCPMSIFDRKQKRIVAAHFPQAQKGLRFEKAKKFKSVKFQG